MTVSVNHTAHYDAPHIPVMLNEVLETLAPQEGEIYVDATFGAGGYSQAMLNAADCRVIAIDRDPEAVEIGRQLEQRFSYRFHILLGCFSEVAALLHSLNIKQVNGIVFDLGVSSLQLDQPERGFSFRYDGPLDMRMGKAGPSAADYINTLSEAELADIFFEYGEERLSKKIAHRIVATRREHPFTRTSQLAELVRSIVPSSKQGIDPATRVFQALRIKVNGELSELEKALHAAEEILLPGGRLIVVSFHSLEDRCVKEFLREQSGSTPSASRHLPMDVKKAAAPTLQLLHRGVIQPSEEEIAKNPRSRSARLRAAIRTENPIKKDKKSHMRKRQ